MRRILSLSLLFIILVSCKNDTKYVPVNYEKINEIKLTKIKNSVIKKYIGNEIKLTEIKNSIIRKYIGNVTKKLTEPKISLCKDCNPKMFRNDTLGGITKFNEKGIYYNKFLKVSDYSIESYRIDFKGKNYKNEIKDEKRVIFHWKFNNKKSKKKFLSHIEYYNRALGKYKAESEIIIYENEIIQDQH